MRCLLVLSLTIVPCVAGAQGVGPAAPQNPVPGRAGAQQPQPGASLFSSSRTNLLGDVFGLRPLAGAYGISFGLAETSEVFGNVTGGVHTGPDYDGLTLISAGLDAGTVFGWKGGVFNVSALQIHGRDLAIDNTDNLNTPSGIEALRSTRLWELWFQQTFLGGRADLKVGQQSLDQEFMISTGASAFINTVMGWPMVPSYDLYAGGPAYPLSSLGVRVRWRPADAVTVLAGVFDDNPPAGPFNADGPLRGAEQSGTAFNLDTGALVIGEMQVAVDTAGGVAGSGPSGLYKVGFWYDSGAFPNQADPSSPGLRHDWSLYGVADQTVWQPDPKAARALGVFLRVMGAPDDRNLVSFGMNTGLVLKAPLPGRDNDTVGFGYGLTKVSEAAIKLDGVAQRLAGSAGYNPVRSSESFVELTYQTQIAPWWAVQPDAQYVFLPGGGIADPDQARQRVGNEAIFGVRTNITF